jgi:hypothetical protein
VPNVHLVWKLEVLKQDKLSAKAQLAPLAEIRGFSGVFRGFRAELANLAHFGSPYLNVAT